MARLATLMMAVSLSAILSGCTTTSQLTSLDNLGGRTFNQIVQQYGQPEDSYTFTASDIAKMRDSVVSQKVRDLYPGKKAKDAEIKSCDWTFGGASVTMYFHQNNNEWTFLCADKGSATAVQ
jgi:hypothetical protein